MEDNRVSESTIKMHHGHAAGLKPELIFECVHGGLNVATWRNVNMELRLTDT